MSQAPTISPDIGVVWSAEHGQVVVYHLVRVGDGVKVEAHLLGCEATLRPSADLRTAIEADMRKRGLYPGDK